MTQTLTNILEEETQAGLCSSNQIFKIENHDEAYYIWKDAGIKQRILIHIDAHNDMWWMQKNSTISIANFICLALKEDIIKEVFWIVPDKSWKTSETRNNILRNLKEISQSYPGSLPVNVEKNQMSTVVLGKLLKVCTISSLPYINECVLLDIDIDYFVIPYVSYRKTDKHTKLPWCWPGELIAKLNSHKVSTDLITIAYSVEGGYTPLMWKYLGDELALRLEQSDFNKAAIHGMELIKEAATITQSGDLTGGEEKYHEARILLPNSPVPYYHLALLYAEMERNTEAQKFYQQALRIDPSYRTPYNSTALQYYLDGGFLESEKEYRKVLLLDPEDAYAHLGLGLLAIKKKNYKEAEALLRRSLELDKNLTDAYRSLGDVFAKLGRIDEAIVAYEISLKLSLAGFRSLEASIVTCTGKNRIEDPYHHQIHAKRASLYALKGQTTEAINGYKISIAGGYDHTFIRYQLACLYLKQNNWKKALQEIWLAVMKIPSGL